jgi:hypothetical protein
MMIPLKRVHLTSLAVLVLLASGLAQAPPALKSKVDAEVKQLRYLSTDPKLVSAVKAFNATPASPDAKAMTNDKWHTLTVFDPFVRAIGKNSLSEYLKSKRDEVVVKIFVSGADGTKAGYDAKTEFWTHKGMPKHEVPMKGSTFLGPMKLDNSTGLQMIQIGLPVLDGAKPIGSVVIGLRADKLK